MAPSSEFCIVKGHDMNKICTFHGRVMLHISSLIWSIMFHGPVMTNLFLIWIPETYFSETVWKICFLLKYSDPPTTLLQTVGPWNVLSLWIGLVSEYITNSYTQLFLQWNTSCNVVKFVLKVHIAWLHRYWVTRYTYWGAGEEDKLLQIVCPFHC